MSSAAAVDPATQGAPPGELPSSGYPSNHGYLPAADTALRAIGGDRGAFQEDAATASCAFAPAASSRNPGDATEDIRRQRYLAQSSNAGAGVQDRLMSAAPNDAPRIEELKEEFASRSNDQFGAFDNLCLI